MRPCLALAPVLVISFICSAQPVKKYPSSKKEAAFAFKEYQIGMLLEDLVKIKPTLEFYFEDFEATREFTDTIADQYCGCTIRFEDFGKGRQLVSIGIAADKSAFDLIISSLIHKYGEPASVRVSRKQNAMGAKFQGSVYTWSNKASTIHAEEIGSTIGYCNITWMAKGLGVSIAEKARNAKAKSDM